MKLAGQGNGDPAHGRESGYAMAALLVGMSVMAVLMTAALPSWTHMAQREKEEEYLFRAKQYARAIQLYNMKMQGANMPAPSVDFLIEQRFLRKKYKDPLTGEDFVLVRQVTGAPPGFGQQPGGPSRPGAPGQSSPGQSSQSQSMVSNREVPRGSENGPFIGVKSKSKAQGIKLFKGQQTTYDQWEVTMMDVQIARGGMPGANPPGTGGFPSGGGPRNNQSPFTPGGGGQAMPFPGGGGFGRPMQPTQPTQGSPFGQPMQPPQGSPFQNPGMNQSVPKFPPFPNTTPPPTTQQPQRRPG